MHGQGDGDISAKEEVKTFSIEGWKSGDNVQGL